MNPFVLCISSNIQGGNVDYCLRRITLNPYGSLVLRFLDDIIITAESLHAFINDINTINPSIQFTLSHTILASDMKENVHPCTCEKSACLAFLDTSLSIKNGQVSVDLYRKPTDRNQYLLTSSCHPAHVTIPTYLSAWHLESWESALILKPERKDWRNWSVFC